MAIGEHPAAYVWKGDAQMLSPIIWVGTATTTGGIWSVDYSAAGFASPPIVTPTAQLSTANTYDRADASLSTAPTNTTAAGYATRGSNLLVLGPTTRNVPDGTLIHVMVIGETLIKQ